MSHSGFTLISATPSPYARKVRIYLAEKEIPFTLQTEVPWDSTTTVPQYNPLEKLPVLIFKDGTTVYESHLILEYLELKFPGTAQMLPESTDDRLLAKQIEVVADGICDALVLRLFELRREPGKQSKEWEARQMRKVEGGLTAIAGWVGSGKNFIIGGKFGLADVAVGCVLGYIDVRFEEFPWRERWPDLARYHDGLSQRESFRTTVPVAQDIKDKIV